MRPNALMAVIVCLAIDAFADERLDKLSPEHHKWLEQEVDYIITEDERDLFLSLETVEERANFIDAFWLHRDPNPAALENEFKEEHYRRLDYVNRSLGRETGRPAWKTDRGRIYIILGEPQRIDRFEAQNEVVQSEIWFYQADPQKGLPSPMYLLFFRKKNIGEFRLYHPVMDGPNALMTGYQYTPAADTRGTLQVLSRLSPELAHAALSVDAGESGDYLTGKPSLFSDTLFARIEESPKRAIRSDYADAYLRYGNRVSTDYSFRFVPSQHVFAVFFGPQATPFVHFSVELEAKDFTLETADDRTMYYTTLDVSTEVRDREGTVVALNDQVVYLEFSPSQLEQVAALPFAYQDAFPLLPGEYQVSVVLRNRVVKQYTVAEQEVRVEPMLPDKLSQVVLGYLHERLLVKENPDYLRAFQIDDTRIYPAAQGVFPVGAVIHLFTQVHETDPEFALRFAFLDGEEVLQERETKVGDYFGGTVVEEFSLIGMVGGRYVLRVQLIAPSGSVVAERAADVVVSPRTSILRPGFIYRRGFKVKEPGLLALTRGEQLWKATRFDEAMAEFTTAVAAQNPQLPMARWKLAGAFIALGQPDRALELLEPMEDKFPDQYEVIGGIGYVYYLKEEYTPAVEYLERAMTLRSPDASVLNAVGDSYEQLENLEKAKEAYRRSLELDPKQDGVKKKLAAIDSPDKQR